jgi:hypothetical protein
MSKEQPGWLPVVRKFCHDAGIGISGWGPDTLVVEAKSPERARQISSQLQPFGFAPIESEDDTDAGLLLLSRNPAATRANEAESRASADLSRRPLIERVLPAFEALFSIWLFWFSLRQPLPKSWFYAACASIALLVFLWDVGRTWGWRLQMAPEELRVRRYFRWSVIPWAQIRAVEVSSVRSRGSVREAVTLTLSSNATLRLGVFGYLGARALRDRLRQEIAQRRNQPK